MPVIIASRDTENLARRETNEVSDTQREIGNEVARDRAAFVARAAHLMPGSEHHTHHHGDLEGARNTRARFTGAHRHLAARESHGTARGTATLSIVDEDVLIFHEVAAAARLVPLPVTDDVVVEAARRRRRARAPHRAFRLTLTQFLIGGLLLVQLLMVLWLQSQSLALRNKDHKLRLEIAQTREQIAQKKNQISQLDSEAHLSRLAAQLHWNKAPMTSFDKLNDTRRLTSQETAALDEKPASGALIAQAD